MVAFAAAAVIVIDSDLFDQDLEGAESANPQYYGRGGKRLTTTR